MHWCVMESNACLLFRAITVVIIRADQRKQQKSLMKTLGLGNLNSEPRMKEHEVLGTIKRLISFDTTRTA
jgi:hypothetical protein